MKSTNKNVEDLNLEFGKCIMQHSEIALTEIKKNLLSKYQKDIKDDNNKILELVKKVPFYHAPLCPLEELNANKSSEKIEDFNKNSLNKSIKLAAVGLIMDDEVIIILNTTFRDLYY